MRDRRSWSCCCGVGVSSIAACWKQIADERTKLFLAVEPEVSNNDDQLTDQSDPERWFGHRAIFQPVRFEVPGGDIREDSSGTDPVWCSCTSNRDCAKARVAQTCRRDGV